jgi:formylmethanofuran dehydrogenase subunit E
MTTVDTREQPYSEFDRLLKDSTILHGHCCPGQVLGVRMSMLGLREIGIADPKGKERKDLMVFVEMDRCATDAVQSVTGCTLGKRSLRFLDYGKMAASFLNLRTGTAVRVRAREEARLRAADYGGEGGDKYAVQAAAYRVMPDEELFEVSDVQITPRMEDMPGRPLSRVQCDACGEHVQDLREVRPGGDRVLCRPCAEGAYYALPTSPAPSVMRKGHNGLAIKSKIWFEVDGDPVFGRGRRFLLEAIDTYGSINRAAREIGISYRKAWGHIKTMESRLGIRLVERSAGGRNGGGAVLTGEARQFLMRFEMMEEGVREFVDERFRRLFQGDDHVR